MKNTTNAFQDGIVTDQNALTMPQTALTSALNATIITGNGNEGLLQNDMGNTLIKDSITGNIMSLSNGFIPLGMKERGGVLYIASYNPETNEGELGTIPSPIIHYTYNPEIQKEEFSQKISDISSDDVKNDPDRKIEERIYKSPVYILSDHICDAGDKFIVILNLQNTEEGKSLQTKTTKTVYNSSLSLYRVSKLKYPQITQFENNSIKRGWFKIKLFAISSSGEMIELTNVTNHPQKYYVDSIQKISDYWFISAEDFNDNLNINRTRTNNLFNTFPNIQSGKLAIQFEEELPEKLDWVRNNSFNKNLPQIVYNMVDNNTQYYAVVHGLQYEGLCPITPDKIVISCNCPIYTTVYSNSPQQETRLSDGGVQSITIYPKYYKTSLDRLSIQNPSYGEFPNFIDNESTLSTIVTRQEAFIIQRDDNSFLINKQLSLISEYSNYDNEKSDGLFFIKIDDFSKEVITTVKLYTKDFNGDDYVLYSEQELPRFTVIEELGGLDFTTDLAQQYLDITGQKVKEGIDGEFDLHLFRGADKKNADGTYDDKEHNACFLYEVDENDLDESPILEYDFDYENYKYRKYISKGQDHTREIYKQLKTWIYPIHVCKYDYDNNKINSWGKEYPEFLWKRGAVFYNNKDRIGGDNLPTIKFPGQPGIYATVEGQSDSQWYPFIFPTWRQIDPDEYNQNQFDWASSMKTRASKMENLGLTTNDLKHYCLFDTNLTCLDKQLNSPFDYSTTVYAGTKKEGTINEEVFFKYGDSLGIDDDNACSIRKPNNLVINSVKYQASTDFDYTNLTIKKASEFYNTYRSNEENTRGRYDNLDSNNLGDWRGYAVGVLHKLSRNSDSAILCVPFLSFMIQSTPGFIPINGQNNSIISLNIINYKNSIGYLYNKTPNVCFENLNGKTASTINYLVNPPYNIWPLAYLSASSYTQPKHYMYFNQACTDISKSYISEYQEYDQGLTIYDNNNCIGISKDSINIKIPIKENVFELNTSANGGAVESDGEISMFDWAKNMLIDDVYNVTGENNIDKFKQAIVTSHILTSLQSNILVNKTRSDITYSNRSDYKVNYCLKLSDGIWNNSGLGVLNDINIESQNLIAIVNDNGTIVDWEIPTVTPQQLNYQNSFCKDSVFAKIPFKNYENPLVFSHNNFNKSISSGLYAFNLNYTNFNSDVLITINLTLSSDPKPKTIEVKNRHIIPFYIKNNDIIKNVEFKISGNNLITNVNPNNLKRDYISNVGLFKVDYLNNADPASADLSEQIQKLVNDYMTETSTFQWIDDIKVKSQGVEYTGPVRSSRDERTTPGITESDVTVIKNAQNDIDDLKQRIVGDIVFPATFCFRELDQNGNKLGCLDETYSGFQALPLSSYQQMCGVYYLKDNIYACLQNSMCPEELKNCSMQNFESTINSTIIRKQSL